MVSPRAELQAAMAALGRADRHLDTVEASHSRATVGGYLTVVLSRKLYEAQAEFRTRVKLALLAFGDSPAALPFVEPTPLPPKALTEAEQWDAIHEDLQAAGRGQP